MSGGIYNGEFKFCWHDRKTCHLNYANPITLKMKFIFFLNTFFHWSIIHTDEVGALVLDPGHQSFRVGYAGEDIPKIEIPSMATYVNEQVDTMETDMNSKPSREYLIDNAALHVPRKNGELHTFLKDCMIEDWDLFENFLNYIYKRSLSSDSELHPVLMSEAPVWILN